MVLNGIKSIFYSNNNKKKKEQKLGDKIENQKMTKLKSCFQTP